MALSADEKNVSIMRFQIAALALIAAAFQPGTSRAAEFVVYSVYQQIDLGNANETPEKDFYVNMGSAQGVHAGTVLNVLRRVSTYDVVNEKLYKDVTFAFARLKVIHSEGSAAIARLEKLLPEASVPAVSPRAVMIGDVVQIAE